MAGSPTRSSYELAALRAVNLAANGLSPGTAWDIATREVCHSPSSATKSCPQSTFLGLAETGLIAGVRPGEYIKTKRNKNYAIKAVSLLQQDEGWAERPRKLWQRILNGASVPYSYQMHIVVALWKANKIV